MNKDQFFGYIKNPEQLDKTSVDEIYQMIKEYPYFQTIHLLYIKNLLNQKDIKFDNELKIASLYSSDRKVLYNLLNYAPTANENITNEHVANTQLSENILQVNNEKNIISTINIPKEDNLVVNLSEQKPKNFKGENIDTIIEEKTENEENGNKSVENFVLPNNNAPYIENNIQYLNTPVDNSPEFPKKESIAEITLKRIEEINKLRKYKDEKLSNDNKLSYNHETVKSTTQNQETLLQTKNNEIISEENKIQKDFDDNSININVTPDKIIENSHANQEKINIIFNTDIIKISDDFENNINQNEPKNNKTIEEEKIIDIKLHSFSDWLEIYDKEKNVKPNKPNSNIQNQINLIDNFIKEEPRIKPQKIYNKEITGINSNNNFEDGEDLITETLANIYKKQGYYNKAINVLNKLSLKYPEKSIYFANQIFEIDKLINNNS